MNPRKSQGTPVDSPGDAPADVLSIEVREQRIAEAVQWYLAECELGRIPDRSSFLSEHADVRDELETCLASLDLIEQFAPEIKANAAGDEQAKQTRAATPVSLGDFRILREIGRGGMGVVYEAEQTSLGRRVALKVLPFAGILDSRQLQRFKNEARAAATLNHPHIVPVYFVGMERGVHYFAMQLIEGCSLAYVIDQLWRANSVPPLLCGGERQGEGTGQRSEEGPHPNPLPQAGEGTPGTSSTPQAVECLTENRSGAVPQGTSAPHAKENAGVEQTEETDRIIQAFISTKSSCVDAEYFRQIARIGLQAAEALEYAHSHGIVHRDIKPGNLLLDAQQDVWLTDFGLARLESDVTATATGDVLGTLRYMSPEQAAGDRHLVDSRSDVYSLGATLYELLTLRPVVDGPNRPEILKRIESSDPFPPRRIAPAIPVDLETIVLKALEKDPGDRYPSAQHLAADLDRFLQHRPIEARRPSVADRLSRVIRRNTVLVSVIALCMAIVTSMAVAGSIFLIHRNTAAEQQRVKAENERNRAEQHLAIARKAINTLLTQSAAELKKSPGTSQLQLALLDNAVQFYEQFPADITARADIRYETALVYIRVAKMCQEISTAEHRSKAQTLLERAIDVLEALAAEDPANGDYRLALIEARTKLAQILEAIAQLDNKHTITDPKLTQRAVDLARELLASDSTSRPYRDAMAEALVGHVRYCTFDVSGSRRRRPTPAQMDLLAQACDLLGGLVEEFPADEYYRLRLAECSGLRVAALQVLGELEFTGDAFLQQLEITRGLVKLAPDNRDYQQNLVRMLAARACGLRDQGDYDESDSLFNEAITIQEQLQQADPDLLHVRSALLQLFGDQINSLLQRRMFADASVLQKKQLDLLRLDQEYDSGDYRADERVVGDLYAYAMCLLETGKEAEARQAYMECIDVSRRLLDQQDGSYRPLCVSLQVTCPFEDLRDDRAMYELVQQYLHEEAVDGPGSRHSDYSITVGWAACRVGRWQEALEAFGEANVSDYLRTWTKFDVVLGRAVALDHIGQREVALRQFVLAHRELQRDAKNVGTFRFFRGRALMRQALALCQLDQSDTLVCIDKLVLPQDNGVQDLDPAERSVAVRDGQPCFQISLLTAPVNIDDTPRVDLETTLTRDGETLQEGIDYLVETDPAGELATIRPIRDTFYAGCYEISVEGKQFLVAVMSALPATHELKVQSSRNERAPLSCHAAQEASVLVPLGSVWKYLDDGTDQGTAWHASEFDDSQWKSGPAQLGFGETDQVTTIGYGPDESNKYLTTYFRHDFDVSDPDRLRALELRVLRDDGVAVFLNGQEVFRDNLIALADFGTFAQSAIADADETTFLKAMIDPNLLAPGTNHLAVEIHQCSRESSDLSFDLMLTAPQSVLVSTETLFGTGESQIREGSIICQATLKVADEGDASEVNLIRLSEPASLGDNFTPEQRDTGSASKFNVRHTLQAWSDGEPNHGWALLQPDDAGEQDVQLTVHFLSPQDAAQVAWLLATSADSNFRDPATALQLAERAVKYADSDALSWAAYGAALYRAGRFEKAVAALETAEELPDTPAAAQIVSAMAQWQLGNHEEARQVYDQFVAVANNQSEDADTVSRLSTEAASLLGISASDRE